MASKRGSRFPQNVACARSGIDWPSLIPVRVTGIKSRRVGAVIESFKRKNPLSPP